MRSHCARACAAVLSLAGLALSAGPPGIWLDVPFIRQEKDGCGAAAIAMVMQYWSREKGLALPAGADPHRIQQEIYAKKAKGIFASEMERYFQGAGYRTFAFRGEWADLQQHLSKGRPLIVSLRPGGHGAALHYVVVAGLDGEKGFVFLNDPAQRKLLKVDRAEFEKEWNAAGNWTLLALPKRDE